MRSRGHSSALDDQALPAKEPASLLRLKTRLHVHTRVAIGQLVLGRQSWPYPSERINPQTLKRVARCKSARLNRSPSHGNLERANRLAKGSNFWPAGSSRTRRVRFVSG